MQANAQTVTDTHRLELVIANQDGERRRYRLAVTPIFEVPSGTSGPWLRLADATADANELAAKALATARQGDRLEGLVEEAEAAPSRQHHWWLDGAHIELVNGPSYWLSPQTVCWTDTAGEPCYDCDWDGAPTADMMAGENGIGPYAIASP